MGCCPAAAVGLQPLGLTGPEASGWAAQQRQASHWVDQLPKPSYWRNPHCNIYIFHTRRPSYLAAREVRRIRTPALLVCLTAESSCLCRPIRPHVYIHTFIYTCVRVRVDRTHALPHCSWDGAMAAQPPAGIRIQAIPIYFESAVIVYSYLFVKRLRSCSYLCSKILFFLHF